MVNRTGVEMKFALASGRLRVTKAVASSMLIVVGVIVLSAQGNKAGTAASDNVSAEQRASLIARGRYLAIIGVCAACHTPPNVASTPPTDAGGLLQERIFRTDPDWYRYLDPEGRNFLAGGVPFILRFDANTSGIVYTPNITPHQSDGLGQWTLAEIAEVIRSGRRRDGSALYMFAPHTFFKNLAKEDALALAMYLKSIPPRPGRVPPRQIPFPTSPAASVTTLETAPSGRTRERAVYLTRAITGCKECHSQHTKAPELQPFAPLDREPDPLEGPLGPLIPFAGAGPGDPFEGVFRLGPDLPLRSQDKGIATFPYPGYAVLYGGNLTRFGNGGDLNYVSPDTLVRAIRQGIGTTPDDYGRPRPLSHVMMWQFYSAMSDDDAFAIADYLKALTYVPHRIRDRDGKDIRMMLFGDDWAAMFEQVFGERPSANDRKAFGKQLQ